MSSENSSGIQPVQPGERFASLDVIRGFALFGILLVNMLYFSSPAIYLQLTGVEMWTSLWDKAASGFISIFAEGKFYSMFSFLFGLGFTVFMERAQKRRKRPILLFFRRLFILLIIGLVHAFLIWSGDILVSYAVLGFFLTIFYARKPKTILIWALIFFMLALTPAVLSLASVYMIGEEELAVYMQGFIELKEERIYSSLQAYGEGSFAEVHAHRVKDTLFTYNYAIFAFPLIFPMFLFGLYAGKRRIFQNIEENMGFIKKVWMWGLIIGLSMSLVKYISMEMIDLIYASKYELIYMIATITGDPALCFFYVTSIILLMRNQRWKPKLLPLANVGRMALTNYLMQSIICTIIFYSYGLGLYGKIGPAAGIILTLAIFAVQVVISNLWFARFKFGPMEWLWRTLTYGKVQPILLANEK